MDRAEVVRRQPFSDNPVVGERGAVTQNRILEAGLEVFATHGYHDAGVELVTEAAGCSRPAFYQYFASKEDLFWQLATDLARAMGDLASRIGTSTPDEDGLAAVTGWLDELVDLSERYGPIIAGFQAAARERNPDSRVLRKIGGRLGSAVLASAGPEHPELDTPALANVTVGVAQRSIFYWQLGIGELPRSRFVPALAATMHRLLHGRIDDVNTGRARRAPSGAPTRWPERPDRADDLRALRPRGRVTRQALLDAARGVLVERGYHGARVDDIAARAEVSHGTFYRYFENTADLFHVLAREAADTLLATVEAFPEDPSTAAVRAWLRDWFRSYRTNGSVLTEWQALDHDDPELARFSLEVAAAMFDHLHRIVHRRGFGDSAADALVLMSVIERVPYNVQVARHIGEGEALDAATFFLHRALLGLPPAESGVS